MGSANKLQALKPDTGRLKKLIENSLLGDWVIRIEYGEDKSETEGWQQWGQAYFAVRSADDVIAALMECYTANPSRCIRMNAEKVRPQTRMLYTVCRHQALPGTDRVKPGLADFLYPENDGSMPLRPALAT